MWYLGYLLYKKSISWFLFYAELSNILLNSLLNNEDS